MTNPRAGFTLLEVVIALAILAVALVVLIDTEAAAVLSTQDGDRLLTASRLAEQKMSDVMLQLEEKGFTSADQEEAGDFEGWGEEGEFGDDLEFGDTFADYQWAWVIRKVDLQVGDLAGAADQLTQLGGGLSSEQQESAGAEGRDLGDVGLQPDMISELLAPYIREVRVVVWWGEEPDLGEPCQDCVELVTHAINPSGDIADQNDSEANP